MSFNDYQLRNQLGSGCDGISFLASEQDGSREVEVCDLSSARDNPDRFQQLQHRLRLVAQLDHDGVVRLLDSNFDHEPPFVVLEWHGLATLALGYGVVIPRSINHAFSICRILAGALADAHGVGLVHGEIEPSNIRLGDTGCPRLDFTGIDRTSASDSFTIRGTPGNQEQDRTADIYALGSLYKWVFKNDSSLPENELELEDVSSLIRVMQAIDPAERPTARQVEQWFERDEAQSVGIVPPLPTMATPPDSSWQGILLGRFRLLEILGEGGQGIVYRALDTADGSTVAVKTLRPELASQPEVLRRFRKESRMLAQINNPNVVNLLEHNEDGGVGYLVMEYVTGQNLENYIKTRDRIDEPTALRIAADIARALENAHACGIVHRDVKPANILLIESPENAFPKVKLSDFGLARNLVDSESMAMTDPGSVLGTPFYMAPEQCTGRPVDSRTDVYSLGITLFHMLAGRVPFRAESREQLFSMHCHEPPPSIRKLSPEISAGVGRVIERALAKAPDDRYPDASAFLRDLERLTRGEPSEIQLHPLVPEIDSARSLMFEFRWELDSLAWQLWPLITNTDRLDRALGFPHVRYTYRADPERGVRQFAEGLKAGMTESWEEYPYEWVEPRRMGVLREYTRGPFRWLVSTVELVPRPTGGTTLIHTLRLEPRGWVARLGSRLGVGVRFRATLGRVYERIDASLRGKYGPPGAIDPFEPPPVLPAIFRERLERRLDALAVQGIDPRCVEQLGDLLLEGSPQEISRIRPKGIAKRWGCDPETTLEACLQAVGEGLLVLLWDILCPKCRLSCEVVETLRALREHGRCEACQLDFELDFTACVELIFRAHPEVREADTGLYCSGGPAHAPHIPARIRVAAGERIEMELSLPEGSYRLGGPRLTWSAPFKVQNGAITRRLDLDLDSGPGLDLSMRFAPGGQVIVISNPHEHERVFEIERESPREDVLTAAEALTFPLFRERFPYETLSPGRLCNVGATTLLVTSLAASSDPDDTTGREDSFTVVYEHFRILEDAIRRAGGTLVKTIDEGVLASFRSSEDAVRLALELPHSLASNETTRHLRLRMGINRGPVYIASIGGRVDYFGETTRRATQLLSHASWNEMILGQEIHNDPGVNALLDERGLQRVTGPASLNGFLIRI